MFIRYAGILLKYAIAILVLSWIFLYASIAVWKALFEIWSLISDGREKSAIYLSLGVSLIIQLAVLFVMRSKKEQLADNGKSITSDNIIIALFILIGGLTSLTVLPLSAVYIESKTAILGFSNVLGAAPFLEFTLLSAISIFGVWSYLHPKLEGRLEDLRTGSSPTVVSS